MGYHPNNMALQGNCRVCGGMLAKEVTTIEEIPCGTSGEATSRVQSIESVDYYGFVNSPMAGQVKSVTDVWCTGCGLKYNPQ